MDLATAGMISGAGNAGTQALQQVGQFVGQSFINQERDKLETERIQLQEQYAKDRQQAGFAHDTKQQEAGFTHDTGLLATREAGENTRLGQTLASHSTDLAAQSKSTEGIHARELAMKERLANAEVAMKSKWYDVLAKHYANRDVTASNKAGESPVDKKQKEFLESVTRPLIDNLSKQLDLAGPDEKAEIQARLDEVVREARSVANLSAPEAPAPGQITNPFPKPKAKGTGGQ
jgi:hypothetical protein